MAIKDSNYFVKRAAIMNIEWSSKHFKILKSF